jgi:hypothetical protein
VLLDPAAPVAGIGVAHDLTRVAPPSDSGRRFR